MPPKSKAITCHSRQGHFEAAECLGFLLKLAKWGFCTSEKNCRQKSGGGGRANGEFSESYQKIEAADKIQEVFVVQN